MGAGRRPRRSFGGLLRQSRENRRLSAPLEADSHGRLARHARPVRRNGQAGPLTGPENFVDNSESNVYLMLAIFSAITTPPVQWQKVTGDP